MYSYIRLGLHFKVETLLLGLEQEKVIVYMHASDCFFISLLKNFHAFLSSVLNYSTRPTRQLNWQPDLMLTALLSIQAKR